MYFFFFQAEDGIRDLYVTGVQTCALPILPLWKLLANRYNGGKADDTAWVYAAGGYYYPGEDEKSLQDEMKGYLDKGYSTVRSEERRVGKECRSRWSREH